LTDAVLQSSDKATTARESLAKRAATHASRVTAVTRDGARRDRWGLSKRVKQSISPLS
jgi:hypothetical protein